MTHFSIWEIRNSNWVFLARIKEKFALNCSFGNNIKKLKQYMCRILRWWHMIRTAFKSHLNVVIRFCKIYIVFIPKFFSNVGLIFLVCKICLKEKEWMFDHDLIINLTRISHVTYPLLWKVMIDLLRQCHGIRRTSHFYNKVSFLTLLL